MRKACQVQRIPSCPTRFVNRASRPRRSAPPRRPSPPRRRASRRTHTRHRRRGRTRRRTRRTAPVARRIRFKIRRRARPPRPIILPLHTLPLPRSPPLAQQCHIVTLLTATETLCKYSIHIVYYILFCFYFKRLHRADGNLNIHRSQGGRI